MINKVILMGRLTKNPEIRYMPSGETKAARERAGYAGNTQTAPTAEDFSELEDDGDVPF